MRPILIAILLASTFACGTSEPTEPTEPDAPADVEPDDAPTDGAKTKAKSKAKAKAKSTSGDGASDTDRPANKPAHGRDDLPDRPPDVVRWGEGPGKRKLIDIAKLPKGQPAFVAMIILDTLRADHTSLCGYERPNTPLLKKLTDRASAWTCDGYSPATWTLPAHASYFTGRTTAEHGVHTLGTPLRDEFETLPEHYAKKGYQTLFISANPVFAKPAGGFYQGFDHVVAAEALVGPLRDDLGKHLKEAFDKLDPKKPVFLVLNIFDAHDPYPEIPKGLDWVEPRGRTSLHPHTAEESNPYYRFVTGTMEDADVPRYLTRVKDAYDHAIFAADTNLGVAVRGFAARGLLKRPHRMVITSDHGEHLGEHGLLRHGSAAWQTVTRVPFLYFDTTGKPAPELPSPLNVTATYSLLKTGELDGTTELVQAASAHNPQDFKPSWVTVAVWPSNKEKLLYMDGKRMRFNLAKDPMEEKPLPVPEDHPWMDRLADRLADHEKSLQDALDRAPDEGVMEMLREVGYVQ